MLTLAAGLLNCHSSHWWWYFSLEFRLLIIACSGLYWKNIGLRSFCTDLAVFYLYKKTKGWHSIGIALEFNNKIIYLAHMLCLLYNLWKCTVILFFHRKQGGTRWASGKSGPLNSHAQDVLKKKSRKADKVGWVISQVENSIVKGMAGLDTDSSQLATD